MQLSHAVTAVDAVFDEPNLITDAGLVAALALTEQIGLPELVAEHVVIAGGANSTRANPSVKVMSLPAQTPSTTSTGYGMPANDVVFGGIRAPSTLGTFLRAFSHGHVQQLNAVLRQSLISLAQRAPLLRANRDS